MKNIVGIKFKKPGKVYFFDPGYIDIKLKVLQRIVKSYSFLYVNLIYREKFRHKS